MSLWTILLESKSKVFQGRQAVNLNSFPEEETEEKGKIAMWFEPAWKSGTGRGAATRWEGALEEE